MVQTVFFAEKVVCAPGVVMCLDNVVIRVKKCRPHIVRPTAY